MCGAYQATSTMFVFVYQGRSTVCTCFYTRDIASLDFPKQTRAAGWRGRFVVEVIRALGHELTAPDKMGHVSSERAHPHTSHTHTRFTHTHALCTHTSSHNLLTHADALKLVRSHTHSHLLPHTEAKRTNNCAPVTRIAQPN